MTSPAAAQLAALRIIAASAYPSIAAAHAASNPRPI